MWLHSLAPTAAGEPAFTVYDLGAISLKRGSPHGGSYNVISVRVRVRARIRARASTKQSSNPNPNPVPAPVPTRTNLNQVGFNVSLAGTGLVDYRGARCRFGGYQGSWATVTSDGVANCGKPIFPDVARYLKGEVGLEFSANGQCYGGAAASFVVYNALVTKLELR